MRDVALPTYTAKDFVTDQDVRWCPGCGDYAILKAVQKSLPKLERKKEDFVFVSGIGCAARFPYYMNTYGMHSIHGRAPAFATGMKVANPDLDVWVVSGDGDLLSIGGNHTMHVFRRNVDINILLLNNRIYGLTKGQYSPTSEIGKKTKSSPMGSVDYPVNPLTLALGAGCTFVARCIDIDAPMMDTLMQRAAAHRGTSLIEVYQDCNIYNHQAWFYASQRESRPDNTVVLEHGKPLIYGKDKDKGLRLNGHHIEAVHLGKGITEDDLIIHDETNRVLAYMLAEMSCPDLPEPLGVIHAAETRPPYEQMLHKQVKQAMEKAGPADPKALIRGGVTWTIGANGSA
ncbi:MAG: 2-oxoacid:ferredoxin oxidoreductase subunit beta [Phycisphaerales bacterium]|nr:2-oxoacid:ferredoxin oxidoreductase subunit beta [Phycisphaerales bacterium]